MQLIVLGLCLLPLLTQGQGTDCVISWNAWPTCSVTCGGAGRSRTGTVTASATGDGTCPNPVTEREYCGASLCPTAPECRSDATSQGVNCELIVVDASGVGSIVGYCRLQRKDGSAGNPGCLDGCVDKTPGCCSYLDEENNLVRTDNPNGCPAADCIISSWTEWSTCAGCGTVRTRKAIDIAVPEHNGGSCETTETQFCFCEETCYSGDTTILTQRGLKKMKDLCAKDMVAVSHGGSSAIFYQAVWWYIHKVTDKAVKFVRITTAKNNTLELTGPHLIPVVPCAMKLSKMNMNTILARYSTFARDVKPGDCVVSVEQYDKLTIDPVVDVSLVVKLGYYSPITPAGNLIAGNVVTSCYSEVADHWLQHVVFMHLRNIAYWLTGKARIENPDGAIPAVLRFLHHLGTLVIENK